jgi:hypothetical protein
LSVRSEWRASSVNQSQVARYAVFALIIVGIFVLLYATGVLK